MTNILEILKTQLEKALNETTEPEDFKESLRDAINACNLNSVAALEQWVGVWVQTDLHLLTEREIEYQDGVEFVEEKWHQITGMF